MGWDSRALENAGQCILEDQEGGGLAVPGHIQRQLSVRASCARFVLFLLLLVLLFLLCIDDSGSSGGRWWLLFFFFFFCVS